MFSVKIKDIKSQKFTHGAKFETLELANEWIKKQKKKNVWGKLQRIVKFEDATDEEKLEAIESLPEEFIEIPEQVVQQEIDGVLQDVVIPARMERVEWPRLVLPQTYEIIIEDITQEVLAEKEKEEEFKSVKELLKSLKKSDMDTLEDVKGVLMKILKLIERL